MAKTEARSSRRDIADAKHRIPVVREELSVGKRKVETGRVRVKKTVREHEEHIGDLVHEEVDVQRVAVDRALEGSAKPRYEGDVLVIPVVEEVLVKQLRVKEELRIRSRSVSSPRNERVVLRSEEVIVERIEPSKKIDGSTEPGAVPRRSTHPRR